MAQKVKLLQDWDYLGQRYVKGDVFEPPHSAFESFMCDQEKIAKRYRPRKLGNKVYETRQMKADTIQEIPVPADETGKNT